MKHVKLFEEFNIEQDNVNTQQQKYLDEVKAYKSKYIDKIGENLKKYGTIKVNFTDMPLIFMHIDHSKTKKYHNIMIPMVGLNEYEGELGSAKMGIMLKFDLDGNLIKIDEKLSDEDLQKVFNYIDDNVSNFKVNR